MSSGSRKTYDTNSIVLRNMYAYDPTTNQQISTNYILAAGSSTAGSVVFKHPLAVLSSFGWDNLPAGISTNTANLLSSILYWSPSYQSSLIYTLPSTVTGLATSGYISTSQLTSSLVGLVNIGYLTNNTLVIPITSTTIGLATIGYVSSLQLQSTTSGIFTTVGSSFLPSTVSGLATSGYISTSQMISSLNGLGTFGYVSTSQIQSSFQAYTTLYSTFSNSGSGNWPTAGNQGYLYCNLIPGCNLNGAQLNFGSPFRSKINPLFTTLDIEIKHNLQFSYYDSISRDYQFNIQLVGGTTYDSTKIIGSESRTYYILNANQINLSFFFQDVSRFVITDSTVLTNLKNNIAYNTVSLFYNFGPNVPTTNQLFACPMSTACATVVLNVRP